MIRADGDGVQTQGENLEDARTMVKDAIALMLDERRGRGEPIPQTGWALVESVEIAAPSTGRATFS